MGIFVLFTDSLNLTINQTACISYRIVKFASSDDDIYDCLLDFFFIIVNLIVDLLYVVVDPRISYE